MARMAREEQFSHGEVAIVHVMNRTVRRCLLMGEDPLTRRDYAYRKRWIEQRISYFAQYFGIDVLCYAVMSNHFHLVLRSRPDVVRTWDDTEVARRWWMICPQRKNPDGSATEPTQADLDSIRTDPDRVSELRKRLSDISWWMRLLCQLIGQRINREDGEVGRVWNRFRAVRLLDETALLACAAYVDLNPIRAAMADTIEESNYTSVQRRVRSLQSASCSTNAMEPSPRADRHLAPVQLNALRDALQIYPNKNGHRCSDRGFLPMTEAQYVDLLDWTARQIVQGKQGFTPESTPPVFERLGISVESWKELVGDFGKLFSLVAGKPQTVCVHRGRRRLKRFRLPSQAQQLLQT